MQSIRYTHSPDEQARLLDFIDSETEKIFMVIGAEEIGLSDFMRCHTKTVLEKGDIFVFQYDIWPREHSRQFLYRWFAETASGRASRWHGTSRGRRRIPTASIARSAGEISTRFAPRPPDFPTRAVRS